MRKLLPGIIITLIMLVSGACSDDKAGSNAYPVYGQGSVTFTLKYVSDETTAPRKESVFPAGTVVRATISANQFDPVRENDLVEYFKVGRDGKVKVTMRAPYLYGDIQFFTVAVKASVILNCKVAAGSGRYQYDFIHNFQITAGESIEKGEFVIARGTELEKPTQN